MIPTPNLPLLEPLRAIPFVGNPLADLLQPDLKVLVNLGYDDPAYGYSTSPANVPTPLGLLPPVNPQTVLADLAVGTQQGIGAFTTDISTGGFPSLPSLSAALTPNPLAVNPMSPTDVIAAIESANTKFANAVTSAAASGYGAQLPTADILTAAVTTVPSNDVDLFLAGIAQAVNGDPAGLVNAVGYPIAADTGLAAFLGGLEVRVLLSAAQSIAGDFTGLAS